jgi:hypothetical protein
MSLRKNKTVCFVLGRRLCVYLVACDLASEFGVVDDLSGGVGVWRV